MTSAFAQFMAILRKDLIIDLRRKENLLAMFFFALLTLMIFYLAAGALQETRYRLNDRGLDELSGKGWDGARVEALRPAMGRSYATQSDLLKAAQSEAGIALTSGERLDLVAAARGSSMEDAAAGFLWVTFLLAGILGLDKSFGQEREQGCMDGLLLTPMGRGVLYLGKMTGNVLFMIAILVLLLPMFLLIFRLDVWGDLGALAAILFGGVLGFTALGTLLGGVVSTLRGKEVLLPLLLFPLLIPVLIGVVQLTGAVFAGQPLAGEAHWMRLVAGFDAVYLIVSFLVFEYVVES